MRALALSIACAACGSGGSENLATTEPRSYVDRLDEARRHEQRAEQHERAAEAVEGRFGAERFECGDPVLNDQLTTGGLRVTTWQPCFDLEDEAEWRHRRAAERERRLARRDRAIAGRLLDAEQAACGGLPERERDHSVFAHRRSIERIEPLEVAGELVGVRVTFEPVRGLDAEWMARSIACQRARWAVHGKDPEWMPNDPTLVVDAKVAIAERDGRVVVEVTTPTPVEARIALARARGELDQTARR